MRIGDPLVLATLAVWTALEVGLVARDALRGQGGSALDRGTRQLNFAGFFGAIGLATFLGRLLRHDGSLLLPGAGGDGLLAAGLAVMWAGLLLRVWSIGVLGAAFRMTVAVDDDQPLVDRGPYRFVRHPSYTGLMLTAIGYGLVCGSWPSLALMVAVPLAVVARRIAVEEQALVAAMGSPYRRYQVRTKRLVPRVW